MIGESENEVTKRICKAKKIRYIKENQQAAVDKSLPGVQARFAFLFKTVLEDGEGEDAGFTHAMCY